MQPKICVKQGRQLGVEIFGKIKLKRVTIVGTHVAIVIALIKVNSRKEILKSI